MGEEEVLTEHLPCARCGYDLFSQPVAGVCPECGVGVGVTIARREELRRFFARPGMAMMGAAAMGVANVLLLVMVCLLIFFDDWSKEVQVFINGHYPGIHLVAASVVDAVFVPGMVVLAWRYPRPMNPGRRAVFLVMLLGSFGVVLVTGQVRLYAETGIGTLGTWQTLIYALNLGGGVLRLGAMLIGAPAVVGLARRAGARGFAIFSAIVFAGLISAQMYFASDAFLHLLDTTHTYSLARAQDTLIDTTRWLTFSVAVARIFYWGSFVLWLAARWGERVEAAVVRE